MSLHLAQKLCVTDDFFPTVFCRNKVEFHLAMCCVLSPPDHLNSGGIVASADSDPSSILLLSCECYC